MLSGTFSGTATTAAIQVGNKAALSLDFAGAATVELERRIGASGDWKVVETFTADYEGVIEGGADHWFRLDCTAHTNDVDYVIG